MPVPYYTYSLSFVDEVPLVVTGSTHYRPLREGLFELLNKKNDKHLQLDIPVEAFESRSVDSVTQGFRNAAYGWADAIELKKQGKRVHADRIKNQDGSISLFFTIVPVEQNSK